jgi:hypothetical protein
MVAITNPKITSLQDNEVFVFGSNEAGRHGKGAAKLALQWGCYILGISANKRVYILKYKL